MKAFLGRRENRRESRAAGTEIAVETRICAIDFGTARTRSAHAISKTSPEIGKNNISPTKIVNLWPGHTGPNVASVLRHDGQLGTVWGGAVGVHKKDCLLFSKLLLGDHSPESPECVDEIAQIYGGRYSEGQRDAPLEYLASVMEYLIQFLNTEATGTQSQKANENIVFLLTVPLAWSEKAKYNLLQRALKSLPVSSGHSAELVYEAEAALGVFSNRATHKALVPKANNNEPREPAPPTINEPATPTTNSIVPASPVMGEIVIIYDIGFFIARMMAYQVVSQHPVLKFKGYCQAADGLCGSVYLDRFFTILIKKKLQKFLSGPCPPPESWVRTYMEKTVKTFSQFIKWDFKDRPATEYTVQLPCGVPDDPAEGIRDETLTLYRKDILSIFNPVLNACEKHIQTELKAVKNLLHTSQSAPRISAFVLVGGVANSPSFQKRVRETPEMRGVRVISPQDCSSTTVVGAIEVHHHGGLVEATVSKLTLGTMFWKLWEDSHPSENRIWERYECKYYTRDCMRWFLKRGYEYNRNKTIRLEFYKNAAVDEDLIFEDTIWTTDRDESLPAFKDSKCRIFATLICRLPDAIKAKLERLPRPVEYGGDYFAVSYAIELRIGAVITAKVFSGGSVSDVEFVYP